MYMEIKYLLIRDLWDKSIFLIKVLSYLNISLQEFNNLIDWEIFL